MGFAAITPTMVATNCLGTQRFRGTPIGRNTHRTRMRSETPEHHTHIFPWNSLRRDTLPYHIEGKHTFIFIKLGTIKIPHICFVHIISIQATPYLPSTQFKLVAELLPTPSLAPRRRDSTPGQARGYRVHIFIQKQKKVAKSRRMSESNSFLLTDCLYIIEYCISIGT